MTGRPRLPDPDGKHARRRAQRKIGHVRALLKGKQVKFHGAHHEGMALLKQLMGDVKPDACKCGDEQITLSLAPLPGSTAVYVGVHSSTGHAYTLSTDPADYVWECHSCNVLRDHRTEVAA